jgi:hypothetical protein
MGSKTGTPMSQDLTAFKKKSLAYVNEMLARKNPHFFHPFLLLTHS